MYVTMFSNYYRIFILSAFLLPLLFCFEMDLASGVEESNVLPNQQNDLALSDDEISYALSELSVDDLQVLSKLVDVLSEEGDYAAAESEFNSDEAARYKRESSDTRSKEDKDIIIPNVDEEYIRQLDDSFPNTIDRSNRDDREKPHIRVKRT